MASGLSTRLVNNILFVPVCLFNSPFFADIKDTKCDVANLEPFQDYCFRIRVENKFGISDPSPSVTAFRSKLKVDHEPKEFKPSDFEVPHKEMEKIGLFGFAFLPQLSL